MGNGIAHVIAQNGYKTNLVDISQEALDKGLLTIAKNLDLRTRYHFGYQHILHFHYPDCSSHQKSGQGYWNALYESRTHYAIGRDNKGL